MLRRIVGFRVDPAEEQFVAVLDCHHGHHVRHRPPWEERPWTQTESGRQSMLGQSLECPKCEWIEPPERLVLHRTTPEWTEETLPAGLQHDHRVAGGVWGRVRVLDGAVGFSFSDGLGGDPSGPLPAGQTQPIPPDRPHHLTLIGPVRLVVDFLVPAPGGHGEDDGADG